MLVNAASGKARAVAPNDLVTWPECPARIAADSRYLVVGDATSVS
jgi:hypothetical protein